MADSADTPKPYARMTNSWGGDRPDNGSLENDSDTTILAGDYRMAPGADTFWYQNHPDIADAGDSND